jgi:hypothetical protein
MLLAHTTPFASVIWLTFARNMPLLGGMYVLKFPFFLVAVVSTHFQEPPRCFWMMTGTSDWQAATPLVTLTCPETRLCGWNPKSTEREVDAVVVTVKSVALVAVPPGVVTVILPVVEPVRTVAVILVAELTVNVADVPLNLTEVAPVRFVPVIVTLVPTGPLVGVNDVIVGVPVTVKFVALVAVPAAAMTVMGPVVAPAGTIAVTDVAVFAENVADVPLNLTDVTPLRFVPVMTTLVPTAPLVGANDVIVGAVVTVKFVALSAVPTPVVTCTGPVVAPAGTIAVICVAELTV